MFFLKIAFAAAAVAVVPAAVGSIAWNFRNGGADPFGLVSLTRDALKRRVKRTRNCPCFELRIFDRWHPWVLLRTRKASRKNYNHHCSKNWKDRSIQFHRPPHFCKISIR